MIRVALLVAIAIALAALAPASRRTPVTEACAFAQVPSTYEAQEDRRLYMAAMELAGFDMLFPGDTFFSQPSIETGTRAGRGKSGVYIPPTLLKSISWIESGTAQAARGAPFASIGPALVSFDCGYGIAQVTSGMTTPIGEGGQPSPEQSLVATHFAYNIGRGATILLDKWNGAPEGRPVAGIDTNSDPRLVENWYFALWGYNGFTGPGANRSNHPLDPIYGGWPRTPYSCGPANDGFSHNRAAHPYQELVYGCAAHPPVVQGRALWTPLEATMPDLNNPYWRNPLQLTNFQYPYAAMDIPTPKPEHTDPTPPPHPLARLAVLGFPKLAVDRPIVLVNVRPGQSATPVDVRISNAGTGIVSWQATANRPWVSLSQQAGIAVGGDLPCASGAPCDRTATLQISVDPTRILGSDAAVVRIDGLGSALARQEIAVFIRVNVAIGIPGTTRN